MNPEVTIGICVKNCEKYIEESIISILNQYFSHKLLEIVIVDGYSKDKTIQIVKKLLSVSDIKFEIFYENKGLGFARQIIVDNAVGEYILWVDGDMVLSRNYLGRLLSFMNQHPEIGIVKGKQALQLGSNLLGTLEGFSRAAGRMIDYQSEKGHYKTLGTAGALCRTKALKNVGGFDRTLRGYNEDWDMEIRVQAAGWLLCAIDVFYQDYERHGLTWENLWKKYWLRGYYTHFFLHKNKGMLQHYRMFPPASFLAGLLYSHKLFSLTKQKLVFLLPFQSFFKMIPWYIGFIRSHFDSYQPKYVT